LLRWGQYVPVAARRATARREMDRLRRRGKHIHPIEIEGRTIARSFWGKGWCEHLESFSDYANRLPRGRTYARNGSVCHLDLQPTSVEAIVCGSELYNVSVRIKRLKPAAWRALKKKCSGRVGSMLELLQGRLSDHVMAVVTEPKTGLFPQPSEIEYRCSCPDWASMCKHVAAVMYGIGHRLDDHPELLFVLRGVDAQELISTGLSLPPGEGATAGETIADHELGDIFGIDIEQGVDTGVDRVVEVKPVRRKSSPARREKTTRAVAIGKRSRVPGGKLPRIRPTGKSVVVLRERLGLSVAQFALKLGVTAATVYRWQTTGGRLSVRPHTLVRLARLHQRLQDRVRER